MGINHNSYAPQVKPRHSLLSHTDSLDTLSPCESICSDDMMMDFECNSGRDSIERSNDANHTDADNATKADIDENKLWNEFEQNGGGMFKDWSYLLKMSRNTRQDISVWVHIGFVLIGPNYIWTSSAKCNQSEQFGISKILLLQINQHTLRYITVKVYS